MLSNTKNIGIAVSAIAMTFRVARPAGFDAANNVAAATSTTRIAACGRQSIWLSTAMTRTTGTWSQSRTTKSRAALVRRAISSRQSSIVNVAERLVKSRRPCVATFLRYRLPGGPNVRASDAGTTAGC